MPRKESVMNSYKYLAYDKQGTQTEGILQGDTPQDILFWLKNKGYTPISVDSYDLTTKAVKGRRRLSIRSEDMASFCWQLNTMVEGGVPITEAIDTIVQDINNHQLQEVLKKVSEKMRSGQSIHDSVREFPSVFNDMFCAMMKAGEASGMLTDILKRLADYYDKRDQLKRKVRRAMAYPIFVISFVVLIVVVMMIFLIPRFADIFESFGGELPLFTQMFMAGYNTIVHNVPFVLGGIFGFILLIIFYNKTKSGHERFSRLVLRIPLLGTMFKFAFLAGFARSMSTLLAAGVSVLEAFEILEGTTRNDVIKAVMEKSRKMISDGLSIAVSMGGNNIFPPLLVKMTQVGENSGSLPAVLDRSSDYYERKLDSAIEAMVAILEPALIIMVGAIILVVLLALYLPIFTISDIQM
jgi:type IV pilus assembly protein PilC